MKHLIYRTKNQINGKFYIGVHSTNNKNDGYLGSGKYLRSSIEKYGKENFEKEILAILPSKEMAFDFEEFIVGQELIDDPSCYNITLGGKHPIVPCGENHPHFGLKGKEHFNFGRSFSKKVKNKISTALKEHYKENDSPFKGKKHDKETRKKISESRTGIKLSEKHCKEISERVSGEGNPMYGKRHDEESIKKMEKSHKSRTNYSGKSVTHIESGKEFPSIAEAARQFNMNVGNVGAHCRGNRDVQKFKFSN